MTCDEWLCWSGWAFIGTAAQIVSLGALVFAIMELVRRRRRLRDVVWRIDLTGTVDIDGDRYHLASLHNAGAGSAMLVGVLFFNSRPHLTNEHRSRGVFSSGEEAFIPISAKRIDMAWIMILWTETADDHRVFAAWYPVTTVGAMRVRWETSGRRTARAVRFRPRRWRRVLPIGPNHYAWTSYRVVRAMTDADGWKVDRILSGAADHRAAYPWGNHLRTKPAADLPYVAAK